MSVKVLEVDPVKCRMELSIKQLSPDPLKQTLDNVRHCEGLDGTGQARTRLERDMIRCGDHRMGGVGAASARGHDQMGVRGNMGGAERCVI